MSNKITPRKDSSFIISTIGMSFLKELRKGLAPFSNDEKTEVLGILMQAIGMMKANRDYKELSEFFSENLLRKYGTRAKKAYNLYQSNFFSGEHVLLRFLGSGPGMIYTEEEFYALDGFEGGQVLSTREFENLLNAYQGMLYTMKEDILLSEPGSQAAAVPEPHAKKTTEDLVPSLTDNPQEAMPEKARRPPAEIPDGFMDALQACKYLHIKLPTLYARIKKIPHYKHARRLLFRKPELDEYIMRASERS